MRFAARFAEAALVRFGWAITSEVLSEIDTKLVGEADREDARPRLGTSSEAERVCLADVPPSEVAWLWPGRIALGKVTLLAGDPGLGKSMVTLDIAARVSRGTAWPDAVAPPSRGGDMAPSAARLAASTPASVVLLSAEDDLGDTIRPRLEAHGADCTRIVAIQAIAGRDDQSTYRRSFDLGRDLERLTETIDTMENCRLVIIDPISAYLGRAAENANAEVRSLLGPLAMLAAERRLAIVVVTHLRKEEGAAMYRTMGSLAFIAAARSAWIICKDPFNPRRRLLLPVKNNLASDTGGLAYTIEPLGMGDAVAVCWSAETIETPADTAMIREARPVGRPADERDEVARWLADVLAPGPLPAGEVREAAEAHGFAYATLRKAFRDLGGRASRHPGSNAWQWQLAESNSTAPNAGVGV